MSSRSSLVRYIKPFKRLLNSSEIILDLGVPREKSIVREADLRNKLISDTVNYFLSKIIPGLLGFLAVVIFVRLVGYEQYGRYAVVLATVTAVTVGVSGWLSQGILRFQSEHHETARAGSFNKTIDLGLRYSAVFGGGVLGVALWLNGNQSPAVLTVSIGLYVTMLAYTVELTRLQAFLASRAVVYMEGVRAVSAFLIPIALVLVSSRRHYWLLLLGMFSGYLIPVAGHNLYVKGRLAVPSVSLSASGDLERNFLRTMWSYGWPVALWLFSQQSLVVSDRYFVQRFWGYSAAGVYASMYDVVVRSLSLIFAPITLAVHTVLMFYWNAGHRHPAKRILFEAMKYELFLFLPVAAVLFLCRGWVSRLVLGHGNSEAAPIVLSLAIGGFLWQLALLAHKPLEILCQTKRMLGGALAALAVNVVGNLFLVPRFGYRAAAYLSVASPLVYLMMLFILTPVESFQRAIVSGKGQGTAIVPAEELGA